MRRNLLNTNILPPPLCNGFVAQHLRILPVIMLRTGKYVFTSCNHTSRRGVFFIPQCVKL